MKRPTAGAAASRLRRLTTRGAALLAVASVAATATTAAVAASTPMSAADKALFAYAKCMRDKGVKIPDPARGKDGRYAFGSIPTSVTAAAGVREKAQACAATSGAQRASNGAGQSGGGPSGFRGGQQAPGQQSPGQQAAFKKFQDCLKANGATTPAPGQRPQRPSTTTPSATKKPGTTTAATVTDPKTGKPLARPTLLGQGPGANDDGAGRGGARGGFGGRGGVGGGDAKTQAAFAKCRSLLPARPGGPGGFGGPPAAGARTASK